MEYIQNTECTKWQFECIPEFKGGSMSPVFADCGTGKGECTENTAEHSFMHTFFEASACEVKEYARMLKENGMKLVFENSVDGNLFYQFICGEGLLYLSYLKGSRILRIMLDRCEGASAAKFGSDEYEEIRNDTLISQYSLHYDDMIKGTTCDCGMNYVLRLHDNSVVIIDGGEMEQSTDIAVCDFMKYLHEITDTPQNGVIRVSMWLCTHAHNDHCDFMSKIIRFYGDEIVIERAAFNFPHPDNVRHSPSVAMAKSRLFEKYPSAQYIKLHAGMNFNIANARFDILLSAEDTVALDSEELLPCTNATSIIFSVTADGVKTIFLADCCSDDADVLVENYTRQTLKCNIVQAAHHGINEIYNAYEAISAEAVMLPQCEKNMHKRFQPVYDCLCEKYGEKNIYFAHDATYIFTAENGKYSITDRAHTGSAYDGSEW
ncbi:MAG: hypothetical protein MJ177_02645 [Clostridia bacterium]|nr:hypothetical protein [Clostridia bacterium]